MDLVQIVITVFAVLGIVVMGAMAVVPEALELRDARAERSDQEAEKSSRQTDHELVA